MDNVTHSLLGAALAMLATPAEATRGQRRLFLAAGIAAANAPDLDLLYVGIMPAPLGYLLHHRGHTHTIAGLAALGALFGLGAALPPIARRLAAPAPDGTASDAAADGGTSSARIAATGTAAAGTTAAGSSSFGTTPDAAAPRDTTSGERSRGGKHPLRRFALLIAAGLVSHLLLDACNSYGVHPFYPFDSRWVYGDTLFIIEPWLWLLLAAALPWQTLSRRAGLALVLLLALFATALIRVEVIHIVTVASMAVAGAAIGWGARHLTRPRRALAGLTAAALFVGGMFGASRLARAEAAEALAPRVQGALIDIVLSPNPASPWCWSVIGVERDTRLDRILLHRGTLSLAPSMKPAASCVTHRLLNQPVLSSPPVMASGTNGQGHSGQGNGGQDASEHRMNDDAHRSEPDDRRIAWTDEFDQPLEYLRALRQRDCWTRAWLQFGRAPLLLAGTLQDLRFANGARRNFTMMPLTPHRAADDCPPHVTPWDMPRADLFQ